MLFASCSALKNRGTGGSALNGNLTHEQVIEQLNRGNVSKAGFYIQKAEVEVRTGEDKQKFIISWKRDSAGTSLISLRSRTGIEAARILLDRDTLLINDRINRIMYFGHTDYVRRTYGLPAGYLQLLLGDFVGADADKGKLLNCNGGVMNITSVLKGTKAQNVVDCRKGKIVNMALFNEFGKKGVALDYSAFINSGDKYLATKIRIEDYERMIEINIKLVKMDIPWEGEINFIPGKNYELSELK